MVPKSWGSLMLDVYFKLRNMRSIENFWMGKDGVVTIRDLIKWSNRR